MVDGDGLVSEYSYDKMYNLVGIRQYKKGNENDCMIRSYKFAIRTGFLFKGGDIKKVKIPLI